MSGLVRPRERADEFPLFEVAELRLGTGVFDARLLDDDENSGIGWAYAPPSQATAVQEDHDAGKNLANGQHPGH